MIPALEQLQTFFCVGRFRWMYPRGRMRAMDWRKESCSCGKR